MFLTQKEIQNFQDQVYTYYKKNKRDLPWRTTSNPYHILISEVMLQQTQVPTVLKKYSVFLEKFPTVNSLAKAPLSEILKVWQGLGYNRRAVNLKRTVEKIVKEYNSQIPHTQEELRKLPAIGKATSASILAFAFNEPTMFIETNIRSVMIHSFLKDKENIDDSQIIPLVEQTLDRTNPKEWYNALMDYGTFLKNQYNPNQKSKHYKKQSSFKGSTREIRGEIIKELLKSPLTQEELIKKLNVNKDKIKTVLIQLQKEEIIHYKGKVIYL